MATEYKGTLAKFESDTTQNNSYAPSTAAGHVQIFSSGSAAAAKLYVVDGGGTKGELLYAGGNLSTDGTTFADVHAASPSDASFLIYDTGNSRWNDAVFSGDVTCTDAGVVSIAADAVGATEIRLENNSYLTARNAANNGDLNVIKANGSDVLELGLATTVNGSLTAGTLSVADTTISDTNAALTLTSTVEENADGGRESQIIFKGEKADGTAHELAEMRVDHDGSSDDKKGMISFSVNDGSDSDGSLTEAFSIASDKKAEFFGVISGSSDLTINGEAVIQGNLTVRGATTTVDTTNITIEDNLLEINRGTGDAGTRASNANAGLFISGSIDDREISLTAAADGGRLKVSGSSTVGTGFDVVTGGDYAINGTSVLNATTLGGAVVASSLTSVGALNVGSVTSGFGAINNGSSAITTTGLISGGSLDIDNVLIDGATIGHTDDTDLITLANGKATLAGDLDMFVDANDADVAIQIGTSAAEALKIEVLNGGSNKTAEEIKFSTATASSTTDHGKITFNVDAADIVTIQDDGINLASGKVIEIDGNQVLSATALASAVKINNDNWSGTDLAVEHGGTGASTFTSNALLTGNGTSAIQAESNITYDGTTFSVNDDMAVGSDGTGHDVKFYGDSANELMMYTAADNTLKITDAAGTAIVTLGGDANGEYAVDVQNQADESGRVRANAFVTYSARHLKKDIEPIADAMPKLNALQPVTYNWKSCADKTSKGWSSQEIGFIADDVHKILPQVTQADSSGNVHGIDYSKITALLTQAVKQQDQEIKTLKAALSTMLESQELLLEKLGIKK